MKARAIIVAALFLFSCASPRPGAQPSAAQPATEKAGVPLIENKYAQALTAARERHLPLFVHTGGQWSHFSRWMRAAVFPDAAMTPLADRAVWLFMDAELPENAPFFEKGFVTSPWGTQLLLDPRTEKTITRWDFPATPAQIALLVERARLAMSPPTSGLEARLVAADRLMGDRAEDAFAAYLAILKDAPPDWRYRSQVTAAVQAAAPEGDITECARIAEQLAPTLDAPDAAVLVRNGLQCALERPKDTPGRKEVVAALEPMLLSIANAPPSGLPAVDLSQIYRELTMAGEQRGDKRGAAEIAERWMAMLDRQAQTAPTPAIRAALDMHRVMAAVSLGEPSRAIPALLASEKDLPSDYNPPMRLATLYRASGLPDQAMAAADRALVNVYGLQKARVLMLRAELVAEAGRKDQAKQLAADALAHVKSLPQSQVPEWLLNNLKQRSQALQ